MKGKGREQVIQTRGLIHKAFSANWATLDQRQTEFWFLGWKVGPRGHRAVVFDDLWTCGSNRSGQIGQVYKVTTVSGSDVTMSAGVLVQSIQVKTTEMQRYAENVTCMHAKKCYRLNGTFFVQLK